MEGRATGVVGLVEGGAVVLTGDAGTAVEATSEEQEVSAKASASMAGAVALRRMATA